MQMILLMNTPEGWIFWDLFAHCLFGPHTHSDFQSHLFATGEWRRIKDLNCLITTAMVLLQTAEKNDAKKQPAEAAITIMIHARYWVLHAYHTSQVLLSKQKHVESLKKMLELPGISKNAKQGLYSNKENEMENISKKRSVYLLQRWCISWNPLHLL